MNRCDAPALQRKDLERRLKEQRYSLVDSRLWLGGNLRCLWWKRVALDSDKEGLVQKNGFGFVKKADFSAHARPTDKEKLFINAAKPLLSTAPKLTCNRPFQIPLATVSLQQNNPFSKLRSLAFARRHPFRTDSNPHRRYPGSLQFPVRPVT